MEPHSNTIAPNANHLIFWGNSAQTRIGEYANRISKCLHSDDIEVADAALSIQFSLLKAREQIRSALAKVEGQR